MKDFWEQKKVSPVFVKGQDFPIKNPEILPKPGDRKVERLGESHLSGDEILMSGGKRNDYKIGYLRFGKHPPGVLSDVPMARGTKPNKTRFETSHLVPLLSQ